MATRIHHHPARGGAPSVAPYLVAALLALVFACGDSGKSGSTDGPVVAGCPTYPNPIAALGDDIEGDTYTTFAAPFFEAFCTRCHNSALVTPSERNLAPDGLNWDVEATVRDNLDRIRNAVGVINFMPPSAPKPDCAARRRLVRWIDAGAP